MGTWPPGLTLQNYFVFPSIEISRVRHQSFRMRNTALVNKLDAFHVEKNIYLNTSHRIDRAQSELRSTAIITILSSSSFPRINDSPARFLFFYFSRLPFIRARYSLTAIRPYFFRAKTLRYEHCAQTDHINCNRNRYTSSLLLYASQPVVWHERRVGALNKTQ